MRSFLAACGAAAMLLATPALAAPEGPYGGFHVGYAWGDNDTDVRVTDQDYLATSSIDSIESEFPSSVDADGFTFGAFLGWMWVANTVGFGFEGDINWLGTDESSSVMREYPCCGPDTYTIGQTLEQNWYATLRARLGVDVAPNLFLYLTGGLAMADADYAVFFEDTYQPMARRSGSNSDTLTGYTVGVGGELMFVNGVSIRGEYLYIDLGDIEARTDLSSDGYNDVFRASADVTNHVFRVAAVFDF